MNKPQMSYFKKEDILHILISSEEESNSFEINPNNTAELNKKGELIGIEIQNASNYLRDTLLESIQAKILNLSKAS